LPWATKIQLWKQKRDFTELIDIYFQTSGARLKSKFKTDWVWTFGIKKYADSLVRAIVESARHKIAAPAPHPCSSSKATPSPPRCYPINLLEINLLWIGTFYSLANPESPAFCERTVMWSKAWRNSCNHWSDGELFNGDESEISGQRNCESLVSNATQGITIRPLIFLVDPAGFNYHS